MWRTRGRSNTATPTPPILWSCGDCWTVCPGARPSGCAWLPFMIRELQLASGRMSVVMLFALLLQAASIVLLRLRLGKTWLRRPVTLLILTSAAFQGMSPLLLSFPSVRAGDIYVTGISQHFTDEAALIMAAALLVFTIAYLLTLPERSGTQAGTADVRALSQALDWRLLALCSVPLAYLTYSGRGYNNAQAITPTTGLGTALAASFFIIAVALTSFSFILARGPQWFLPVLAVQSLLLAAAGERTPVVADAAVLWVMLCHAGIRPHVRQIHAAVALTVLAILAVTGARAEQGRAFYHANSGLAARASSLADGVTAAAGQPLLAEAASRLDGVSFAGGILQARSLGQPRLSPAYVPESLLLGVPSALWPSKMAHADGLSPVAAEMAAFGMQPVNFLPGTFGMYMGILSPMWLIILSGFAGAVAGWGERWLLRRHSPARMAMLAGAVLAAVAGMGAPNILVTLRTGAAVAAAVIAADAIRRTLRTGVGPIRPFHQQARSRAEAGGQGHDLPGIVAPHGGGRA